MSSVPEWPFQATRRDLECGIFIAEPEELEPRARPLRDVIKSVAKLERTQERESFDDWIASLATQKRGTFHVIAGPTGIGQTQVAWDVAEKLAGTGVRVLYLSLAVGAEALTYMVLDGRRLRAMRAPVGARIGGAGAQRSAGDPLARLSVDIHDAPALTLLDIWSLTNRPDDQAYGAVIIDSVERVVPPRCGYSDEERVWALAVNLRRFGVTMLATCSTLPRETGDRPTPTNTHRDQVPWQFRHEADFLWLLYRENYFRPEGDGSLVVTVESRDGRRRSAGYDTAYSPSGITIARHAEVDFGTSKKNRRARSKKSDRSSKRAPSNRKRW